MKLELDRKSSISLYLQIRNCIRGMILDGTLKAGDPLPPERKLAQALGVNRSTVQNAYRELEADGFVDSHVGRGTTVALSHPGAEGEAHIPVGIPWKQYISESMSRSKQTLVRDLLEIANRKDIISFAAGVAVPGMDSLDALRRIQRQVIKEKGHAVLQHTPTEGLYSLRESISFLMKERNAPVSPEEIIVLSGSQQGIDLLARMFIDPGDTVIVEEPTFFCAVQIFRSLGARVLGVPIDRDGMRVDILEKLLERHKPKFIYTMPLFQNPSGTVLSMERRRQLLRLAYQYQLPIIEDDAYGELRYEGEALPPLKGMDAYGYVIYLSTFSKILFPGFRIGWMAAPSPVVQQAMMLKQMADLHSSSLAQWVMDCFLREGFIGPHLERINAENRYRRDVMLEALEKWALPGITWGRPQGGLYVWCELPEQIKSSELMTRATENGVAFVPGSVFYPEGDDGNHIRLNFTFPTPDRIGEGIKRLMDAAGRAKKDNAGGMTGVRMDLEPIV